MNPTVNAAVAGVARGAIEFRNMVTTRNEIVPNVLFGLLPFAVLVYFANSGEVIDLGTETVSWVRFAAPGMFAIVVAFNMLGPMYTLSTERDDGTLLRVRTLPHGLAGYVVGRSVSVALEGLLGLALVVIPALLFIDGIGDVGLLGWLHFLAVVVFGLAALVPLGLLIGGLLRSPKGVFSIGLAAIALLMGISGIVNPITEQPGWLQGIAQVFPVYWLGLGTRAALLPDVVATVEIGGSWRVGATFAVLGVWAVVATALAPLALRRSARRQSGARLAEQRDAALHAAG